LKYDYVYRLKQEHPELCISINGGIKTIDAMQQHLEFVDGVMLGREAYHNPYLLADVDRLFYGESRPALTRHEVIEALIPYVESELVKGTRLHSITRHLHGLFLGRPGARSWRRYLSEHDGCAEADVQVMLDAAKMIK
jgi:tRNA-dihydrouridine synthase A